MQKRATKITKRLKDYSSREISEKSGLITFLERRKRGNMIETFKMEFLIMVDIFSIFLLLKLKIFFQDRFQKQSLLRN